MPRAKDITHLCHIVFGDVYKMDIAYNAVFPDDGIAQHVRAHVKVKCFLD
jgi:hypothetical protein